MTEFRIGAHLSISNGLKKTAVEQNDIGGNCGQIFAGSPRTWKVGNFEDKNTDEFLQKRDELDQNPYVIHGTYLINFASPKKSLREKSIDCVQKEINQADKAGVEFYIFHPGAHTGAGQEQGIKNVANSLNQLSIPDSVTVLLENTAGKGTTIGKDMSELNQIIQETDKDVKVGLDTCHLHAAGYDLKTSQGIEKTISEIQSTFGMDKLKILHLNDSKDKLGSEKDNHQDIGNGKIGEKGFKNVINHSKLENLPMILETPNEGEESYASNIERLKSLRE